MAGDNRQTLRDSELFWKLSDAQIERLLELCEERSYEPGAALFVPGHSATRLYLVKEGRVALEMEVRVGTRTRRQAVIRVIVPGEVVGWPAITDRPAFTMSAVCVERCRLLDFDGHAIRELFDEDPDFYRKVMDELVGLVGDRLTKAKETLAHVLSVASHDLRTPLATVQTCLDTIIGGFVGEINDRQAELLEGSKTRIADLTKMIDNILDISYIEISHGDFTRVSLPEVVATSIGDVQGIADQKGIRLENCVSADLPDILGVPSRLRQALTNLLGNAVKFTPDGGQVAVHSYDGDDNVRVEVSDAGVGIPPDELPRVFDDFYRGKSQNADGVGLGLPITKKIIEGHGGVIWVESPCPDSGVGTRFSFTLPKISVRRADSEDGGVEGSSRTPKILVTDDDPEMRRVVSLVLESQGYDVTLAADGEEALARIDEQRPDLLILDLLMPRVDGFEVCRRINQQVEDGASRFPVLALTAIKEDISRHRYELETNENLKVDAYMEKPVSPPVLLQQVATLLANVRTIG